LIRERKERKPSQGDGGPSARRGRRGNKAALTDVRVIKKTEKREKKDILRDIRIAAGERIRQRKSHRGGARDQGEYSREREKEKTSRRERPAVRWDQKQTKRAGFR